MLGVIPMLISPRSSGVEHFLGKEEVTGSIPVVGSRLCRMNGKLSGDQKERSFVSFTTEQT
jgi:hypothetical protein